MKKFLLINMMAVGSLLVVVSLALAGCGPQAPPTAAVPTSAPTEVPAVEQEAEAVEQVEAELVGDAVRGGLLYDEWWAVLGVDAPSENHPLWATQSTNSRSGADTWRCKECHGWDYQGKDGAYATGSHLTGFPGVFAAKEKPASEILAALKGEGNPDHDFSTVLGEQDLVDLTLFTTQAMVDAALMINADTSAKGDATAGETLYGQVCVRCHGPQGNAINFQSLAEPEFLGHLAPDNPWEFVHKVRFGQPGWPMPSGIANDWSEQDVANVLAYVQTFTKEPFLSGGGQLYDQWWKVLAVDAPAEDNPLWATQNTNTRSGADTWRCKECHGWDYMGAEGAYGSGSHATGFTGILSSASLSSDELLSWLSGGENPDHDYSAVMDDVALNALVTFIQDEMADITAYVNADGTVIGDPANGRGMFEETCAACHGVDGKKINFGSADEPEYVGTIAADNPWEFFHKASFGQPGAPMPFGRALGWTLEQMADLLTYAQTLPTK